MAELASDIAAHLVAQSVGTIWNGTTGTIFLGMLPDHTAGDAIAIIEEQGAMPMETFEREQPIIERPNVRILSRSATPEGYVESRTLARAAWRALNKLANETVNGTYYQRVQATNSPAPIERDESKRVVFSSTFTVWRDVAS